MLLLSSVPNIFTQLLNDIVRDRASRTLTYNDEQFHILEKIKMQETIRVLVDLLQKECAPVVAQGRTDAPLLFLISNCREISSDQSLKVGFSLSSLGLGLLSRFRVFFGNRNKMAIQGFIF